MYHDLLRSQKVKCWSKPTIRVKSGRLVEIYPTYICFDSEFCPEFKFKILWGQIRSSRGQTCVKLRSKSSNQGQIGQISRNVPNIHMVRLRILSKIQIQNSLRSNQVIRRSNLGQIEPTNRNMSNMHIFRRQMLSRIRIHDNLRLNKATQGSN